MTANYNVDWSHQLRARLTLWPISAIMSTLTEERGLVLLVVDIFELNVPEDSSPHRRADEVRVALDELGGVNDPPSLQL